MVKPAFCQGPHIAKKEPGVERSAARKLAQNFLGRTLPWTLPGNP